MENAISALTTTVSTSSLWSSFQGVVPVLAIIVPFSLAMFFVRKIIKGASNRGQTKI